MLKSVAAFVEKKIRPQRETLDDDHVMHLATAVLLLEVSRADFDIQEEELRTIVSALAERFRFSKQEVENLVDLAVTEQEQHVSIYPFVKIINDGCTMEEKKRLLMDLWKTAYADSRLDKYEEYQIRKIADLLYLPHSTFIQTKLDVQQDLE
ncbi:MAG: TerB family tellurite resistance protein [Gammaproteobacteria bacterium]|nr:TerB family tellurite resistance protein [Gammaproteobacteria bacterium]